MSEQQRHPWDRQEGESEAAYGRFLRYRNLGPERSMARAYQAFVRESDDPLNAEECGKVRKAPRQWEYDSSAHDWPRRARLWDIAMFQEHGREAVVAFAELVRKVTLRALQKLADGLDGPPDWEMMLKTVEGLSKFVPQESLRAILQLQSRGAGLDEHSDGMRADPIPLPHGPSGVRPEGAEGPPDA